MISMPARRLLDAAEAETTAKLGRQPAMRGGASRTWHPTGAQIVVTVHEHDGRPHLEATVATHIRGACLSDVETLHCAADPRQAAQWVAMTLADRTAH